MDTARLTVLPRDVDQMEIDLREVDVAIAMVARGLARHMRIVGLDDIDAIAPIALARSQLAGVDFRIDRGAKDSLEFGPAT